MADGNPNGYYIFYFEGTKVKPRFIPAGGDPTDRLRITLDPLLSHKDSIKQTHPVGLDRGYQQENTPYHYCINLDDLPANTNPYISL